MELYTNLLKVLFNTIIVMLIILYILLILYVYMMCSNDGVKNNILLFIKQYYIKHVYY